MASIAPRGRKRLILALATVLTISGAGLAYAYWTSTGAGDGTATTGTSVAFTVVAAEPVGTLAPGSAGQAITFTITNPGPGVQTINGVGVSVPGPDLVPAGCTYEYYSVSITTPPRFGPIQPNESVTTVATIVMANSEANQDACQGFQLPIRLMVS